MKQFKKKIMALLLLIYVIAATLILSLLNFSYVQNDKTSISRILNMKFQIAYSQSDRVQQEIPKDMDEGMSSDTKGESYIQKSYLVAKSQDGILYIKDRLPDAGVSENRILETAENILMTGKTSGNYQNYQFEISVHENELLLAFADVESLRGEERKYCLISLLTAVMLGLLWVYPAWKITEKMLAPLEEANRLQKEFILFAGHELKTPITVMKASLDMLEREGIHSKYLNYALEENEKMRKLVIELLDYSKMEYKEENHLKEKVNFSQCIEGSALEFEVMAFEKGITLTDNIQQELFITGNEEMLQRMTETLLENAIRHTDSGKEVRIVLEKEAKTCVLSIENQGRAIPEQEKKRLFEKFYHSSESEEGHYGLGLAIAQSIAQKHNTQIMIESKNGWNCFKAVFPVLDRK